MYVWYMKNTTINGSICSRNRNQLTLQIQRCFTQLISMNVVSKYTNGRVQKDGGECDCCRLSFLIVNVSSAEVINNLSTQFADESRGL